MAVRSQKRQRFVVLNLFLYDSSVKELFSELDQEAEYIAVCPNPSKADIFREILQKSGRGDIASITISKFLKDEMQTGEDGQRVGKSELLIDLWTLWKIKVDHNYDEFRFCFDLFTEIRSYSIDHQIISSIEELLSPSQLNGINLFFQYFDSLEIIDEQKSYALAGENFSGRKNYLVWGFDHLNANQIDMLKKLGERVDVFIPIAKDIYNSSENFDWPLWISTDKKVEKAKTENSDIEAVFYSVPEGRLGEYINQQIDESTQLIHINKNISLFELNSTVNRDKSFKTAFDFFETNLDEFFSNILDEVINRGKISTDELLGHTKGICTAYYERSNFKSFKVALTFIDELKEFKEKSEANEEITLNDLKCLREKLSLDLPRTSAISISKSSMEGLGTRDSLYNISSVKDTILIINSDVKATFKDSYKYSAELMSALTAFGPLQSSRFEVMNLKNLLEEFLKNGGKVIFEDGAFDNSSEWEGILSNIEYTVEPLLKAERVKKSKSLKVENQQVAQPSATRVQTYLDCPRKYYYDYIERVDIRARSHDNIGADIKGLIEHEVIEQYLSMHEDWDITKHRELVDKLMTEIVSNKSLVLSRVVIENTRKEIEAYTEPVIANLANVRKKYGAKYYFEEDISNFDPNKSGRIDLLIEDANGDFIVIDFKRSSGGVPSKAEFENYEKIQVWYYITSLMHAGKNVVGGGYINLTELDKSLIYNFDGEVNLVVEVVEGIKTHKSKESLKEKAEAFNKVFDDTMDQINSDVVFAIRPRSLNACKYCVAAPICQKDGQ